MKRNINKKTPAPRIKKFCEGCGEKLIKRETYGFDPYTGKQKIVLTCPDSDCLWEVYGLHKKILPKENNSVTLTFENSAVGTDVVEFVPWYKRFYEWIRSLKSR